MVHIGLPEDGSQAPLEDTPATKRRQDLSHLMKIPGFSNYLFRFQKPEKPMFLSGNCMGKPESALTCPYHLR